MALENLSLAISSQTTDVRTGLSAVKRSLSAVGREALGTAADTSVAGGRIDELGDDAAGTAFQLALLDSRADAAGDEMLEAGSQAAFAGGLFSTASFNVGGLTFSLTSLSSTITAVAVPALVALSTALVPLVGTLAGVAAIGGGLLGGFGLVIGSGIIAGFDRLKQTAQTTLQLVRDQLAGLGQQFVPLLEDGLEAIPGVVGAIISQVGDLQPFVDALRTLGGIAARTLPSLVARLFDLGRGALPSLIDAAQWLANNGGDIFDAVINTTETVLPLLEGVGGAFIDALPAINRFGTGVLQTLLPALEDGIRGFGGLLDEILAFTQTEQFDEIMASLQRGITELAPEVSELGDNLSRIFSVLAEEGPAIIDGFVAIADSVLDIVNALTPVIELFIEAIGFVAGAYAEFTRNSEQQEQNLAQQGILGFIGGGAADLLPGTGTGRPGQGARGLGRRIEGRTAEAQEVVVRVETDDEGMGRFVDARVERGQRSTRQVRTNRAAARNNFSL